MLVEERKLHIIEEVLKINDNATLTALEDVVKDSERTNKSNKVNLRSFAGIWTEEEANEIEKIIEESCETINPDDWK